MSLDPNAVKAVFLAALDRTDPAARAAYVAEACAGDESLRRRVEELLRWHDAPGRLLDPPVEPRGDETGPDVRGPTVSAGPTEGAGEAPETLWLGAGKPVARLPTLELQALLQSRLRFVVLVAFGTSLLFFALHSSRTTFDAQSVGLVAVPRTVNVAVLAALLVVIWRPRPHTLARLRLFEVVLLGVLVVHYLWETYPLMFVTPGWFPLYAQRHVSEATILARQPSIMWLGLIISYGIMIPNTGRRCATVTTLMALAPLTVMAVGGFLHPDIPPGFVVQFLVEMGMWMALAVIGAIYGSHKIETLREEALEARKLGQYQLTRRLGAGGMGEVYLAEHVLLRRPCAVKVIRPERTGDPRHLARFEREAQATAALKHPNTVQVSDYGYADDGTFYYVMEYLPGPTLDELVREGGPLPPARAIRFLRQLCGALAEAHARGLVHRDVKPSNVLVCEVGGAGDVAKLLDFGLVVPAADGPDDKLTQEGAVLGTPSYMSPEQAAGSDDVDGRSDLYSLGCLAYFLLTGRPPFAGRSAVKLLAAHLYEPPWPLTDLRPDVPADLAAVVLRCLAKKPEDRFPDAASLDAALAACAAGRPAL